MSVCRYIQAVANDGCWSLAQRCSISQQDIVKYNPAAGFCDNIRLDDYVCCSSGSRPDFSPKPSADGSCFVYTTQKDDTCQAIADRNKITAWSKIDDYNHNTWGWEGCGAGLQVGQRLCLSTGTPPFPEPIANAVCGPQMPGTKKPSSNNPWDWTGMNQCSLNACCNKWGQCGITEDFCTFSVAATFAPGTSAPKQNGCISNCGRDIINNKDRPDKQMRVAYFEGFNPKRECLHMDIADVDVNHYTHIHFAFADLTTNWDVNIDNVRDQFVGLVNKRGIKRILSFGGWTFSTNPETINIFRSGVLPANARTFARKVVDFIVFMGLDGVDFDWEYPSAVDLLPADNPYSGIFFLEFLKIVRQMLPQGKSLSIAAPASFWYLKGFPIKEIAETVDYIIYMTYDIHGQWDYDNKWASPGCPTGDCLRHHTNDTEVRDALVLITKAGVQAKKVIVGMPLYGRTFKMVQALCSNPSCRYVGPKSAAAPGRCTKEPGYLSNAEIFEIIDTNPNVIQYYDQGDILIYNNTEWVAWMKPGTYYYHQQFWEGYGFGGTSDWAVDLNRTLADSDDDDDRRLDPDRYVSEDPGARCDTKFRDIREVEKQASSLPPECIQQYLLEAMMAMWDDAMVKFNRLADGDYDEKFKIYEQYIKASAPKQVDSFMGRGDADKWFRCTKDSKTFCCSGCQIAECAASCSRESDCGRFGQRQITCPTDLKFGPKTGIGVATPPNTTYTLRDANGFYDAISDAYGIQKDWIRFGNTLALYDNTCIGAGAAVNECLKRSGIWFWNYPQTTFDIVKVFNPKETITLARDKSQNLRDRLASMQALADLDDEVELADLVDAASIEFASVVSAIELMDKVVAAAGEIEEARRKETILFFITVALMLIPVAGQAAGAAGLAALRVALNAAEAAGSVALGIYEAVNDKEHAVGIILLTLIGAGLDIGTWSSAASRRRGMTDAELSKLGPIKDRLTTITNAQAKICRR